LSLVKEEGFGFFIVSTETLTIYCLIVVTNY